MADAKPYIATEPLFVGNARAHNPGDEVPADNVDRNGWSEGVARQGTKAANAAQNISEDDALSVSAQSPPPK